MEQGIRWLGSDFLGEDEKRRAEALELGVPYRRLSHEDISPHALILLPEAFCRSHNLVAFGVYEGEFHVALLDVADLPHIQALHEKTPRLSQLRLRPHLTDRESMKRALLMYQAQLRAMFGNEIERSLHEANSEALVDVLLRHALFSGASALHIDSSERGLLLRHRVGTELHDALTLAPHAARGILERLKTLAHLFLGVESGSQEGRFKLQLPKDEGGEVAVRASIVPTVSGERVTLYFTPEHSGKRGFTIESLGLHGAWLEHVHHMLAHTSGLILVAGGANSGKTTLLYTLLDQLNVPERRLASVEESVEYKLPHVAQTTAGEGVGVSPGARIKALLRQGVDVLMVGEINDSDTMLTALNAANRGTLVLAAIDAANAALGIEKLLTLGVPPQLLAATLRGAIATRLVRRLTAAKEKHRPARIELSAFEGRTDFGRVLATLKEEDKVDKGLQWKELELYYPTSSGESKDGYQGLIGVQEVLLPTLVLKDALAQGAGAADIEQIAREEGMLTLVEDGLVKAAGGLTSLEEVKKILG